MPCLGLGWKLLAAPSRRPPVSRLVPLYRKAFLEPEKATNLWAHIPSFLQARL